MILQLLRQLNNLDRSKTIACSAYFCFGLSLRFPCPLPKRISSRILSKSMFIPQNHPKSQQRVRTCAVIEKPVFRASVALSMLEIELYQISLPYDRGRSGHEITLFPRLFPPQLVGKRPWERGCLKITPPSWKIPRKRSNELPTFVRGG